MRSRCPAWPAQRGLTDPHLASLNLPFVPFALVAPPFGLEVVQDAAEVHWGWQCACSCWCCWVLLSLSLSGVLLLLLLPLLALGEIALPLPLLLVMLLHLDAVGLLILLLVSSLLVLLLLLLMLHRHGQRGRRCPRQHPTHTGDAAANVNAIGWTEERGRGCSLPIPIPTAPVARWSNACERDRLCWAQLAYGLYNARERFW